MTTKDIEQLNHLYASLSEGSLLASGEASASFGVTGEYVARLCKQKKVEGYLVGRLWYVRAESLEAYLTDAQARAAASRQALSERLHREYLARSRGRV